MIKAVIVDDEQPSVDKMEKLLQDSGVVELKGKFSQPLAALDFLKKNPVDAVFLDIEMPDLDGIELATRLIEFQERLAIIFVTAYNQYAVEAFRLNALDYLMKPVTADRLLESLNRISIEKEIHIKPATVRCQCFGKFKITNQTAEVKFRTEKAEELLALLIDRRGEAIHRNEICDSLWEEYDGDRALIHFHTTLYYVKKALLQQGVTVPIEHDRGSYRLNVNGFDCDYCRFYQYGTMVHEVNQRNIFELEEIAGLYGGDYLSGKGYLWAERNRQMLKEQYIALLLQISVYYQTAGNHPKSLEWLKKGLIQEPLHREINYQLIRILLLMNDRLSAGKYFHIYENDLMRKLKQEPDQEFKDIIGY